MSETDQSTTTMFKGQTKARSSQGLKRWTNVKHFRLLFPQQTYIPLISLWQVSKLCIMCNTLLISLFSKHSKWCFKHYQKSFLQSDKTFSMQVLDIKLSWWQRYCFAYSRLLLFLAKCYSKKVVLYLFIFYIYRSNRSFNVSLQKSTVRCTVFVSGKRTSHLINYSEKLINWYPHNSLSDTQCFLFVCFSFK